MYSRRLAQSVRLMMAVAIFLSYGLQFYVPIQIVGPWFNSLFHTESQRLSDAGLRIALVAFTCKLSHFLFRKILQIRNIRFFSCSGRANTESGTDYLFGWSCEQQHIGIDIPTVN